VTYSAHGYDPDQDQLTWTWAVGQPPCPDPADPSRWPITSAQPSTLASPTSYQISPVLTAQCVWVFATDRYGAVAADNAPLAPADNPPQPVIRVVSPAPADSYPAYSMFQLSGATSSDADGDPLVNAWRIDQAPLGSTAALVPCPTVTDPTLQCLNVLVSGQYVVALTVDDGSTTTTASMTLNVLPDQPPCITMTTPMYGGALLKDDPTAPNPIMVNMVTDDGDPFPNPASPLQTVKFTWFKGKNDRGNLQYVDNGSFSMLNLVPTDYQPGDVANVRLEVHDRSTAVIDAILLGCGDADFCPITPGSTCLVRGSWRIEMDL